MKDFNNLRINGQIYSKNELLKLSLDLDNRSNWPQDFYLFIQEWFNEELFVEVNTSGSTGKPKVIAIGKEKMISSAAMTCEFLNLKKGDTALLCLSPKHIGGMMMIVRAIYAELNLIITPVSSNPLSNIEEKIDFIALVPYQVQTILQEDSLKLLAIPKIIIGGGKIDFKLQQALLQHQISAYSTFGMTETISHIALQKIGEEDYYSCLDGIELKLSREGTLIVYAPKLLDSSLETNDLVELLSPKHFKWLGRKDFAIESGGLKFIPEEIERKLEAKIKERFFVSSRPHPLLNNELILLIEGKERNLDPSIFSGLNKYERPKAIFFINSFVETANGKIDRIKSSLLI